jgi:DNA end-binding protein Ku
MRAIWKGTISFGLVSIPVALYPALSNETLKFRLLRKSDLSPVNYKRVAEADGKEVPWDEVVKGYEYEKGKFVVLRDEDFKRVDVEATQSVDIINFVKIEEVDPLLFNKPYFMEVMKGGDGAYSLLHDALVSSKKIGIARVVIKTRQHLAAVKPREGGLMLELMHFPDTLLEVDEFKAPKARKIGKRELQMALALITSMSSKWDPEEYDDDYKESLIELIDDKVKNRAPEKQAAPRRRGSTNVIDLVAVLQRSIDETKGGAARKSTRTRTQAKKKARKKATKAKTKTKRKAA